jgi:hypothetical protein
MATVQVINGDLVITGDAQAEDIKIIQSVVGGAAETGRYRITGQNGTTITGTNSNGYVENVTRDIVINLNDGANKLYMGDGVSLDRFIVPRDLIINTGNQNDSVQLNRITVGDDVIINTGLGNDSVGFLAAVGRFAGIDSGLNDVQITTSGGADNVTFLGGSVRNDVTVDAGSGANTLYFQNLGVGDDMFIFTGTGDDKVTLAVNVNIGDDLQLDTGEGRDVVSLDQVFADAITANLGLGNDEFKLRNTTARGLIVESNDNDTDTFRNLSGNTITQFFDLFDIEVRS